MEREDGSSSEAGSIEDAHKAAPDCLCFFNDSELLFADMVGAGFVVDSRRSRRAGKVKVKVKLSGKRGLGGGIWGVDMPSKHRRLC